jgi:ATP-dependent protease ClpP protease subunit
LEQLLVRGPARDTGRPEAQVRDDLNRERRLDAYEAREYGLIDAVLRA